MHLTALTKETYFTRILASNSRYIKPLGNKASMFELLSTYNFAKQLSWVTSEFPNPQANQHDGIMSVNNINPLSRTAKLQRGDLSICLCAILAWLTDQLFRHCKNQTYITYCLTVRICLLHIKCPIEFVRFQQSAYCIAVFWVLVGKS